MGAEHGADKRPRVVAEERAEEEAERWARRRSRTCWSSAAARAASRSAPGCASSACRAIVIDKHARPGDQWRKPLQVAVPARPGLVRPPAVPEVPGQLAGVRAQGQDRRLARVLHQGDGGAVLGRAPTPSRARTTSETGEWTSRSSARASRSTLRPKHLVLATGDVRQAEHPRRSRAWTSSAATSTTPRAHPGPDALPRQEGAWSSASTTRAFDICGALWETRRRRDDGAAVLDAHREVRHADGHRARRRSTPSEAVAAGMTTEKADLIFASLPVPDPARVPDPGLRGDGRAGQGLLRRGWRRPASSTTGATTAPACS